MATANDSRSTFVTAKRAVSSYSEDYTPIPLNYRFAGVSDALRGKANSAASLNPTASADQQTTYTEGYNFGLYFKQHLSNIG
jgi:hypothetical protein